jgi:cell wall-associated NlpC family hydrolase
MAVYSAREIYRFARIAGFSPDESVTMTAIALAESGGDSRAHNSSGEDSRGLWQINVSAHGDWAARRNLYDPVENAKAAFRVSGGGRDVSPWTTTHGGHAPYLAYRTEAQEAARACGDPAGLGVWTGTPGYGHKLSAGSDGGGDGESVLLAGGDGTPDSGTLRTFLDSALAQTGDPYIFGSEAQAGDPDPDVFDCSELVQWAAGRAGVTLPDGSWLQYLHLDRHGATMSVDQALHTPGALLFSFSTAPTAGGGRPSQAHVAISLGDGNTIEARGRTYGVGSWSAGERFQYAAWIPGISDGTGGAPARTVARKPVAPDDDGDGLTNDQEVQLGLSTTLTDTDSDHVSDLHEMKRLRTDPRLGDSDGDGVPDSTEFAIGTDPLNPDTDWDGRLDGDLRPKGTADDDGDGLTNELEALLGTDPAATDSDNDAFTDLDEYRTFFNPADPASNPLTGTDDPAADPLTGPGRRAKPPTPVENPADSWGLGDLDAPTA